MSRKVVLGVVLGLFVFFGLIYYFMLRSPSYSKPIGGWDDLKSKVELRYSQNEDIKNAAIEFAKVMQESIDYPNNAKEIDLRFDKADACFCAVLEKYGRSDREAYKESNVVVDLATNTSERRKRYIRYNVRLSGGVYPLVENDLKHCNFPLLGR
jgi:hypothetical protein